MMNETVAALAIASAFGSGSTVSSEIARNFSSFTSFCTLSPAEYKQYEFLPDGFKGLSADIIKKAEKIAEECSEKDIEIISYSDNNYPGLLAQIEDPPTVLFVRGKLPENINECPTVSIVGTRKAKPDFMKYAALNGFSLATCGFTVVSGFAKGIDSYSLKGALFAGGKVISVLPCGVDVLPGGADPDLLATVIKYGALVSEYMPGTPVRAWQYARRNRIISGLTQSTLIVEAGITSGAISTAEYAIEQGRTVYAVPDGPYDPRSEGNNFLLRNGAVVASSFLDIIEDYNRDYGYGINPADYSEKLRKGFKGTAAVSVPEDIVKAYYGDIKKPSKKNSAKPIKQSKTEERKDNDNPASSRDYSLLAADDIRVLNLLEKGPATIDEIAAANDWSFAEAIDEMSRLTDLGYVVETAGAQYKIK